MKTKSRAVLITIAINGNRISALTPPGRRDIKNLQPVVIRA
jgi:hypothetical protein